MSREVQPHVREPAENRRETPASAVHASSFAPENLRAWLRNLAVATGAGVFLSLIGALGSDAVPLLTRLAYWVPLMLIGSVLGHLTTMAVSRIPRVGALNEWAFGALIAVALSIPLSLIVWGYSGVIFGGSLNLDGLANVSGPVLLICAAMTALMMLVNRPGQVTHAPVEGEPAAPPRFLERLPQKLRGADLYAVSSEDHYLRLHTSRGTDLILMRLGDALGELEGIEGAQTHRSWWVARSAVEKSRREGDRVVLELKGGAEAPVSRPNVRPLREAGWF